MGLTPQKFYRILIEMRIISMIFRIMRANSGQWKAEYKPYRWWPTWSELSPYNMFSISERIHKEFKPFTFNSKDELKKYIYDFIKHGQESMIHKESSPEIITKEEIIRFVEDKKS